MKTSTARTDNLNAKIAEGMTYHIHTKCYKEYTKKENKLFEEEQSKTGDIQRITSRKANFGLPNSLPYMYSRTRLRES